MQGCNRDFNTVASAWMACTYDVCVTSYLSISNSDYNFCYDYINQQESYIWGLEKEAQVMQNYGCYGFVETVSQWNPKFILEGGYQYANFMQCNADLDRAYGMCNGAYLFDNANTKYMDCLKMACESADGVDIAECNNIIEINYKMIHSDNANFAFQIAQKTCENCNKDGMCQPENGETIDTCPDDCTNNGGGGVDPCDYNNMCSAGESHYNCPTDCHNDFWTYWSSTVNTNFQLIKGWGAASFEMCYPNLDQCFKGCYPYQDDALSTCADGIKACIGYVCQQIYTSGPVYDGCVNAGNDIKMIITDPGGSTAYEDGHRVGCGGSGSICGGNICSAGAICCTYQGSEVCSDSYGQCPQEGNQCGTGYCEIGESCCSNNVCSIGGVCPDSGGGGSCNGDGICDNGENADYCSSDCGCNYDGICQSGRGETIYTCGNDCGCNSNAICESQRGEAYGNCEDCSGNSGGFDPCPGGSMGMNGCEYPQPGSDCSSQLEGSYWTGTDCACPGSSRNLGNGRCEEGGGGGSTQCNGDSICQEGETQEGCPSDCPWGCNQNGLCDDANGEDFNNCPYDCKDATSGGNQDFSTSQWVSNLNSGFRVQQGYGYWADWSSCLNNVESCWSNCGNDYNSCILRFSECAVRTCYVYGGGTRAECVNTMYMIGSNIQGDDQAKWAYYAGQEKCISNARRLNQKPTHGYLRK